MAWYDAFSTFYDRSLENLYAPYRAQAFADLELNSDDVVLDVACGTGQNFTALNIAERGAHYVGVDLSAGMLRAATKRTAEHERTTLIESAISGVDANRLNDAAGKDAADILVLTLALTVVPDWEQVFADAWRLLRPGGTIVLMDVVATKRGFQTWMVERMAQADLSREVWRPMEDAGTDFSRTETDAPQSKMGGTLYFARATKPTVD